MSNDRLKRPDPKEMVAKAPPSRRADLEAKLQKPEIQRALQKAEGGVDADLAAQLAPTLGNDAMQELLKAGSETSTASTNAQATEQGAEEEAEELEQEPELEVEGEAQAILPSFSGPSGSAGGSPWAMGKFFGGDGDGDADAVVAATGRWRPMPSLPEPEDIPLERAEAGDGAAAEDDGADWLGEAREALGWAPWTRALLQRGLRDPVLLCRPDFEPESLDDAPNTAFGRARAALALLASHAETVAARRLAWTLLGAGSAVAPGAMGYSGATARALHGLSRVLALLPNRADWERILEARLCVNARPWAERAIGALEPGTLGAVALIDAMVEAGALPGAEGGIPVDADDAFVPHPAAVEALALAGRIAEIPRLEPWVPDGFSLDLTAADLCDGVDAVLDAFTKGEVVTPVLTTAKLEPLFTGMNALLDALGLAQVELAAAGTAAVAGGVDVGAVRAALLGGDAALSRLARRLVRCGRGMEALLAGTDSAALTALSWEAVGVREGAVVARETALVALAGLVARRKPRSRPDKPAIAVNRWLDAAKFSEARANAPLALQPGIALREGRPGLALEALNRLSGPGQLRPRGWLPAVWSLQVGVRLGVGGSVVKPAMALVARGKADGNAFSVAEGAIALTATGLPDRFAPLIAAGVWLREREEGGALSLLVARWGELRRASDGLT